jgi:hypothetical protein
MAETQADIEAVAHPAPHRDRAPLGSLVFGLVAAPTAWAAQLVINYGLASHVCFPGDRPRTVFTTGEGSIWLFLLTVEGIAVVIAFAGAMTAYRSWAATHAEAHGDTEDLVEAGRGRTRFLALWGLMTSLGFAVAILFSLTGPLVVPLCGY